jgi:hypothetical protein
MRKIRYKYRLVLDSVCYFRSFLLIYFSSGSAGPILTFFQFTCYFMSNLRHILGILTLNWVCNSELKRKHNSHCSEGSHIALSSDTELFENLRERAIKFYFTQNFPEGTSVMHRRLIRGRMATHKYKTLYTHAEETSLCWQSLTLSI